MQRDYDTWERETFLYTLREKSDFFAETISNYVRMNHPDRTTDYEKCKRDIIFVFIAYMDDLHFETTNNIEYISARYWHKGKRQLKDYKAEIDAHKYLVDYLIANYITEERIENHLLKLYSIFEKTIVEGPKYNFYSNMHSYKYVFDYDQEPIDPHIITQSLYESWITTPSKQNMMPYKVHVLGPKDKEIKKKIYFKAMRNEYEINKQDYNITDPSDEDEFERKFLEVKSNPQYRNLKSAPYVLIFTQRVAKPNVWHSHAIEKFGNHYEQVQEETLNQARGLSYIETGMFIQNFSGLMLMHGLDISHTRCLPTEMSWWNDPEFEFLENRPPQIILTAGKGKVYRRSNPILDYAKDYKPPFEDIVNFV